MTIESIQPEVDTRTGRVIWPRDRFVEYEAGDARWGLALGLARHELFPDVLRDAIVDRLSIPKPMLASGNFNYSSARLDWF